MKILPPSAAPAFSSASIPGRKTFNRGQSLPYFIIMMFTLVAAWATIINLAKLLQERMMLQTAADNAALAVAQYQARVLNTMSYLNNAIGSALASGAYPLLTPIPLYHQHYVGHPNDAKCKKPSTVLGFGYDRREESRSVASLASLVKTYSEAQDLLVKTYPPIAQLIANETAARQQKDSDGKKSALAAVVMPLWLEGLKKNDSRIKYYKTIVHEVSWPPGKHAHVFLPEEYRTDDVSWYYAQKDRFAANRKITVTVIKPRPANYPVFSRLLGIKNNPWIVTSAVASAAAYNPRGPSLPLEKNNSTGMTLRTMPIAMAQLADNLEEMGRLAGEVGGIPVIGGPLSGVVGGYTAAVGAVATVSVANAMSSDDTPIRRFDESSNPQRELNFGTSLKYGWEAHLVPVGIAPVVH
jgi:hypothetical protein